MSTHATKKQQILAKIERVIRGARLRSIGSEGDVLMAMAHYLWEEGENARAEWCTMHYRALPGSDEVLNYVYALALPNYGILMDREGNFGWSAILKDKEDGLAKRLGAAPHAVYFRGDATHIKGAALLDSYHAEVIREKIRTRIPEIEALEIDKNTVSAHKIGRVRRI